MHTTNAASAVGQSFFTRTTLDERIFALTGGSELIPITVLPRFIHLQYQSIKNLIAQDKFPLPVVRFAGRNFVRTETLVRYLEQCEQGEAQPIRRRVGRKSNRERAQIAAAKCSEPVESPEQATGLPRRGHQA
jgi:hypothetical protein